MAAAWTKHDDEMLLNTTLNMCEKGFPLTEVFDVLSRKLKRSIDACTTRWYQEFQEQYGEQISNIQKKTKKTIENNGPWGFKEDDRFVNLMIEHISSGDNTAVALDKVSKSLKRSYKACSARWYNILLKKNKYTIDKEIKKHKQLLNALKEKEKFEKNIEKESDEIIINDQIVFENPVIALQWNIEQNQKIIKTVLYYLKKRGSAIQAFKKLSIELGTTMKDVKEHWYTNLRPLCDEKIEEIKQQSINNNDNFKRDSIENEENEKSRYIVTKQEVIEENVQEEISFETTIENPIAQKTVQENEQSETNDILFILETLLKKNEELSKLNSELLEKSKQDNEKIKNYEEIFEMIKELK